MPRRTVPAQYKRHVPDPSFDRLEELFVRELERQGTPASHAHAKGSRPAPADGLPSAGDLAARVQRIEEALPAALLARLERIETAVATDLRARVKQLEGIASSHLSRFQELEAAVPDELGDRVRYLEEYVATDVASRVLALEPTGATELTRRVERLESALGADVDDRLAALDAAVASLSAAVQHLSAAGAMQRLTPPSKRPSRPDVGDVRGQADDEALVPLVHAPSPSRNQPCPCGSGKKYKFCHGR